MRQADALLAQLREIEGDQGVHWRMERARLSMEAPDWETQSGQIRQLLAECIRTDPGWAAPVLLLGELHERLGEAGEAEALYRRAVDMTSANVDVVARLIRLLQQQQRYTEAEAILRRLPADPHTRRPSARFDDGSNKSRSTHPVTSSRHA